MHVSSLLLVAFVLSVSARDLRQEFTEWKLAHNKNYDTEEEHELRFSNFVESVKRIERLNAQRRTEDDARFALNKFSDMSSEEWKKSFLLTPWTPKEHEFIAPENFNNVDIPSDIDWRNNAVVSRVKNQEQCGSCWAFSATETIESAWMMAKNVQNTTFKPLAPQQIVDCDQQDAGCGGGNPPTAYQYVISAGGLDLESAYPYTGTDGNCRFDKTKIGATISGWKYATSEEDEHTLKTSVANFGPLSICVDAQYWQDYSGGILGAWQCAWINELDHCVQAVGYNMTASTPYWLVRNSWGEDWGVGGYIYLAYGDNTCGLTNEATYVVV